MLETYLTLESIAREFKEIVLDTKIIELPSGEPAKSGYQLQVNILITGIDLRLMEQYTVMITHRIKSGDT